jgi:hypothetical protein
VEGFRQGCGVSRSRKRKKRRAKREKRQANATIAKRERKLWAKLGELALRLLDSLTADHQGQQLPDHFPEPRLFRRLTGRPESGNPVAIPSGRTT